MYIYYFTYICYQYINCCRCWYLTNNLCICSYPNRSKTAILIKSVHKRHVYTEIRTFYLHNEFAYNLQCDHHARLFQPVLFFSRVYFKTVYTSNNHLYVCSSIWLESHFIKAYRALPIYALNCCALKSRGECRVVVVITCVLTCAQISTLAFCTHTPLTACVYINRLHASITFNRGCVVLHASAIDGAARTDLAYYLVYTI